MTSRLSFRRNGLLAAACLAFACSSSPEKSGSDSPENEPPQPASFDWQGHRGARGLAPENTWPAFKLALGYGMTTLEMDAVVTRDGQVVLSHEPFLSPEICLGPDGEPIPEGEEERHNVYAMTYEEVAACDCGSKPHPRFPEQIKMAIGKPLLATVIDSAEAYARAMGLPAPRYNVETKSRPETDGVFHPAPDVFAEKVYGVLSGKGVLDRATVQSFDVRTLQRLRVSRPEVALVLLVENEDGPQANLDLLGFVPEVYSPSFELVDEALVAFCREKGMKLVPWTVNEPKEMKRLTALGVDGLITDYPDRAAAVRQ